MVLKPQRGISLLELVVVTGILLLLAGILLPALSRAKQGAKEAKSKGNLRQLYLGLMLYRENYGEKVEYGPANLMGLPDGLPASEEQRAEVCKTRELWKSPLCCHRDVPTESSPMDYVEYMSLGPSWTKYVTENEGAAVCLVDMHCNEQGVKLYAPGGRRVKMIGVRLNGSIETRERRLPVSHFDSFWNP
jgi:type II secretory pathway pseudopilin PulG